MKTIRETEEKHTKSSIKELKSKIFQKLKHILLHQYMLFVACFQFF